MSIDASQLVSITDRTIDGGGTGLEFNGLILTQTNEIPAGGVVSYPDAASVGDAFGLQSLEYDLAQRYFTGFVNSNRKPRTLLFGRYVDADVPGWLQGASLTATLAQIQAVNSGGLTVSIDGQQRVLTGLDFSQVTSFSGAAEVIQAALGADAGSPAPTVTFSSLGNVYRITSGTLGANSSVSYATPPTGGGDADMATMLGLTESAGAIVSPGMAARSEADNMEALVKRARNWVCFMTAWEPEIAGKLAFAKWCNGYAPRYVYAAWDTDARATQQLATGSFAEQVIELGYAGTVPVYGQAQLAQFVLATAASIDFDETNGRITFAYKAQDGLEVTCDDGAIAQTLIAKGYNFYGDYATANDEFKFFQTGTVTGTATWLDTYINKVAINNDLQLALVSFLAAAKSVPFNRDGDTQLEAAALDPINKYLNFGAIRQGVSLSSAQASQVNTEAGIKISDTLATRGWYLQWTEATAQVRVQRRKAGKFWWMDGGSVQFIDLSSTTIL